MKPRSSKNQLRDEIRRQTDEFLSRGGAINQARPGETGVEPGGKQKPVFLSGEPRQERTYVNDVVSAVEERKKQKVEKTKAAKKARKPRKKIIYDDFGEPLREVWVEE